MDWRPPEAMKFGWRAEPRKGPVERPGLLNRPLTGLGSPSNSEQNMRGETTPGSLTAPACQLRIESIPPGGAIR